MAQTFSADMKRAEFESQVFALSSYSVYSVPESLRLQLAKDKILAGAATSDERVVMKRRAREAAEQAYERDIEMRVKVNVNTKT